MASIPYRPSIDGLRALSVLAVFLFHLNPTILPGGFVGVDVFFVISGYLITSVIQTALDRGQFQLSAFFQRRIARLFPQVLLVSAVTLVSASLIYSSLELASCGTSFAAALCSIINFKYLFQSSYFTLSEDSQPFLHFWSLSLEEQFYLLHPCVLLAAYRWRLKTLLPLLVVFLVLSLGVCLWLSSFNPVWAFYLLPARAWELLAGSVLAVHHRASPQRDRNTFSQACSLAGLLMLLVSFVFIHEQMLFPGWIAVFPVLGTVLVLTSSSTEGSFVGSFLSSPLLVSVGKLSYSLYLWHWPVFSMVNYVFYASGEWTRLSLKIGLSIGAAVASYIFVEKPARVWLGLPSRRTLVMTGFFLCVTSLSVVGFLIHQSQYVNASPGKVAAGGLYYATSGATGTIALMGDSNGSMYARPLKLAAPLWHKNLLVLSVADGNPLPLPQRENPLWNNALAAVIKTQPETVILACDWLYQMEASPQSLTEALDRLRPFARRIILITTPPRLPERASRAAIRNGARPPFVEDLEVGKRRRTMNAFIRTLASDQVHIVDVETLFHESGGELLFTDSQDQQIYDDYRHLSNHGTQRVLPLLEQAVLK